MSSCAMFHGKMITVLKIGIMKHNYVVQITVNIILTLELYGTTYFFLILSFDRPVLRFNRTKKFDKWSVRCSFPQKNRN